jgi:hypothetical protein
MERMEETGVLDRSLISLLTFATSRPLSASCVGSRRHIFPAKAGFRVLLEIPQNTSDAFSKSDYNVVFSHVSFKKAGEATSSMDRH